MLTISNYVKAKTIEEAYELNQARNSRIMGGMMWMRLGNARVKTLIDLSGLGLDKIEEKNHVFRIGAMCTLRQLEQCEELREAYGDGIAAAVRHIVGVQFRNQATVGGSIYGRYGFSDVLTALLALDTFVELYNGGTIRLSEFVNRKPDKDILLSIIIRKGKRQFRYQSVRRTKTDFQHWEIPDDASEEEIAKYASEAAAEFTYGTNMRGSADYRRHLAEVLLRREISSILAERR